MKKKWYKIAILVVPMAAVLTVLVFSTQLFGARQQRRMQFGGPDMSSPAIRNDRGPNIMQLLRRLDLTDEQAKQIKEIQTANKEKRQAAQKALAEAKNALNEAVVKGANEAALRDAATAVGKSIGDAAVLRANTTASVKKILTEEQRTKLEELRKEVKERPINPQGRMQWQGFRGRYPQMGPMETPYGGYPEMWQMRRGGMRGPLNQRQMPPWGW